ncbi:DUF445 domain-containing protein [Mycolicibacterium llatzerense]|uniref:DUF445 domain-containing protein n=1 Tax=Mycolicibacterium llatzerense TaxID=280871 RepID=UPI0021B5BFB5|nr:DUF445 family protein [Mycolicibacterium llatzerense]MCT7365837.1 hypothetical protein [Mycolicibacterium llatzerense]
MNAILDDIRQNYLVYLTIPFIGAFIGYITKLVAVEMLFRPVEFRGIRPFLGWQGIIPRYAPRMASVAVDLMLARLLTPQEIIDRIDPIELATKMQKPLSAMVDDMTRQVMLKYQPGIWEAMPEFGRSLLIKRIQGEIPSIIQKTIRDLRADVTSVLDLKEVAMNALTRDTVLLIRLIRQIGRAEMSFIVRSGVPFGFILGTVQMVTWALTHNEWVMPAFGAFTGLATDWIALQMIFRPIRPTRYFGLIRWQGLFHKRRAEVSKDYAGLIAYEILTPSNIIEGVLDGPNADKLKALLTREVHDALDSLLGIAKPLVVFSVGGHDYQHLKRDIADATVGRVRALSTMVEEFAVDSVEDVRDMTVEKMSDLTDDEYEGLLRPAFKQDEWKIVLIGGLLGFLVGELQIHLLLT